LGRYVTVSAKVRREIVEEARRLGINVSELIRKALEDEVQRRKLELLEEKLRKHKHVLEKLDIDKIVELIREDREAR
jgi:antitoxin CcdA